MPRPKVVMVQVGGDEGLRREGSGPGRGGEGNGWKREIRRSRLGLGEGLEAGLREKGIPHDSQPTLGLRGWLVGELGELRCPAGVCCPLPGPLSHQGFRGDL